MRKLKAMIYNWISTKYMHDCSNYNSLAVRKSCRSKAQGRAVFKQNNFPHALGTVFLWPWKAHLFSRKYGFPLVVKPNVSGYSRGSYFPINTTGELYKAIFWAKVWWPTTVIEQHLYGANYRVLAGRDGLLSVIRRYPPFVTGNGAATIETLIETENQIRADMELYPTIFPIDKSRKVRKHLARQGLSLSCVPAKGKHVELFYRVALAPGGIVETIDQSAIPPQNLKLFSAVVKAFDANILGIDIIFEEGIEVPYKDQKCILVEVNSRPYIKMHHYPRYGRQEDFKTALDALNKLEISDQDIF